MKTIDKIIDIMHSPESSDSAVLWAGSKFDALSKEDVQSLYQRGKISLEELKRHPTSEQSIGDVYPKSCPCCTNELVVLKVWDEWNYYLCENCKAIYDYKGNKLNEEDTKKLLSKL